MIITIKSLPASKKKQIPWNKGLKGVYKATKETKEKMSKAQKGKHNFHHSEKTKKLLSEINVGHPPGPTSFKKGFTPWNKGKHIKGHPMLMKTKLALLKANKGSKRADEARAKMSEKKKGEMPACLSAYYRSESNNCFGHIKWGDYDINGKSIFFRSKWEANYALYLDFLIKVKQIIKWEYEPDTFIFEKIKFGTRSYKPDFKVFNLDKTIEYHEVKGYMDPRSKTKIKRMAKYYPKVRLIIIDTPVYKDIKNKLGRMLKFY